MERASIREQAFVELVAPVTLAGFLYIGSGIGLLVCFIVRATIRRNEQSCLTFDLRRNERTGKN